MKVKKIGTLCKARGRCYLITELTEEGEIKRQWISNGAAMWLVSGLPLLTESNLSTLFDYSPNVAEKIQIKAAELPQKIYDVTHDLRDGERLLQESSIRIRVDGDELMALTAGERVIWVRSEMLAPCWTKETQLVLRETGNGDDAVAVCDGLFLVGIVMPAVMQEETFGELLRLGVSAPRPALTQEEEPEEDDADQ